MNESLHNRRDPVVLLDLDGVLVDLLPALWSRVREIAADGGWVPEIPEEQTTWRIAPGCERTRSAVRDAFRSPGLFAEPAPIPGALDAVRELRRCVEVVFCTSPHLGNPTSASDKLEWVGRHFGGWAPKRTIIAPAKTLVVGEVLVDDRPDQAGASSRVLRDSRMRRAAPDPVDPSWTQIVYDAPYNRDAPGPRVFGWGEDSIAEVVRLAHERAAARR